MKDLDLVIVTWHQTYLSSYAGGYVRLREFLKRIPSKFYFVLLDNKETIYSDILPKISINEYKSPKWIGALQKRIFIIWFLLETISSTMILYRECSRLISSRNAKVLYFPTGEFLQLYITSFLIKIKFKKVKVVLDILNYGILDESYRIYFSRLRKNRIGLVRSIVITSTIYFSHALMRHTISHADYIFTVSKDFVKKIHKDYKKNTIDYTPSGVNIPVKKNISKNKKFLGVYVGRMTVEKGIFDVLAVWSEVVKKLPNAKLALAGYADNVMKAAILKEIKERKIYKNVIFFEDVTEKQKNDILSKSELFLHLARQEPLFPVITILEGFSYGLPAVIYNMNVLKTAIKQFKLSNKSMYIIQSKNIQKAALEIIGYEKLTNANKRMRSAAAIKNAALFSWDMIAQKEFNIIESIIRRAK